MRLLEIFLAMVLAPIYINVNCNPVEFELELEAKLDSQANSSSQEIQTKITITMTTEAATATASDIVEEIQIQTTKNYDPEIENEKTVKRRKCSGNRNQTQSKSGNQRLIPFPLCKPIQGLFYTGLCAVVCGLPLKSDENSCRFSNEDKAVFCDCGGAEEGEMAACTPKLVMQTHCAHPELNPSARVCRSICRKLGKSYDFCLSPRHSRRAFCSCFDASRSQRTGNGTETEDVSEEIPAPVAAPASTKQLASSSTVVNEPETVQDDDDVDVDVDDNQEKSCTDNEEDDNSKDKGNDHGTGNGTVIKNLRQKNNGPCHPVLGAHRMKICAAICGGDAKTCRVNREYRSVYCDCPGNEVGPEAFCGPPAEMYKHCFTSTKSNKRDCQSICSEMGKRGEICLNPQNSQALTMCSCFTG